MTKIDRHDQLRERLLKSRFAANTDHIMSVVRGKAPLLAGMQVEVERAVEGRRAPNGESYHVKIKASTETIARDSGIIPMTAWRNGGLKSFTENPIILAYHDHEQPIGRSVHTELSDTAMLQYWEFHDESEVSRMMHKLYEKGFMRAASVGFLVHEFTFVDELNDKDLEKLVSKYGASAVRDIYWIADRAELLETSAVPVPSDPNALAFSFAARNAEAIGLDVSSIRDHTNLGDEMNEVEAKAAADAARKAAEATQTLLESLRADVAALGEALKSVAEAIVGLRAIAEKSVVTPAAGTSASVESAAVTTEQRTNEGETELTIEKLDGETDEAADARYVEATVAKVRGAPIPKNQ